VSESPKFKTLPVYHSNTQKPKTILEKLSIFQFILLNTLIKTFTKPFVKDVSK
jgi:hypothetical protein